MEFAYTALPGDVVRPLLDVQVGSTDLTCRALVDSGAVNTIFGEWAAREGGIHLDDVAPTLLRVGGGEIPVRFAPVSLAAAGHEWEAEVGFSDAAWTTSFALLGHHAFFTVFTVTLTAARGRFSVIPSNSSGRPRVDGR